MTDAQSEQTTDNTVDGSYPGSTENLRAVGTKNGVTILKCLYCGEKVPKNWGNASRHVCGAGEDMDGPGCCESTELTDHWVTLEESKNGRTESERKKKCENCGTVHPLDVMNRV